MKKLGSIVGFLLLDGIVTFQLTAQFLFMDPAEIKPGAVKLGVFLMAAALTGGLLLAAAGLLRGADERGLLRERSRRAAAPAWPGWVLAAVVFGGMGLLARAVLPALCAGGPPLSAWILWTLSAAAGLFYALLARELYTVTLRGGSHGRYALAAALTLGSVWLLYLAAGNPGGISTDSLSQLSQAMGREAVTDAHPALLTFLYRCIWQLTGRVWVITACLLASFAAAAGAWFGYLSRRGLSRRWLTLFVLLFGLWPVNGLYATILWKDVPYTAALLWLTLLLLRAGNEGRAFFTPGHILETGVCLALTMLLRHNGAVVLLAGIAALTVLSVGQRSPRPVLTALLAAALVLGVRGPLFRSLEVERRAIYDPAEFLHGMAYVQTATGEEDPFLTAIAPAEVWEEVYTPYNANLIGGSEAALRWGTYSQAAEQGAAPVLRAYLRCFARHPFLILKDRLYGCNLLWNPVPSGYNYRIPGERYQWWVQDNDLGISRRDNLLTQGVDALYALSADPVVVDAVVWRPGWCLALVLLLLWRRRSKRGLWLGALPMGANALSLGMAMAWQDYRYVFFVPVCAFFLFLSYFTLPSEIGKDKRSA